MNELWGVHFESASRLRPEAGFFEIDVTSCISHNHAHKHAKLGCDYRENREGGGAIGCAALCETVVSAGGSPDLRKDCACSLWCSSFAFAFSPLFAILTSLSFSRSRARPRPRPRLQGHRRNAAVVGNDAKEARDGKYARGIQIACAFPAALFSALAYNVRRLGFPHWHSRTWYNAREWRIKPAGANIVKTRWFLQSDPIYKVSRCETDVGFTARCSL